MSEIDFSQTKKPKHSLNWTFQNLVKPNFEGVAMDEWIGKCKEDYKKYYNDETVNNPMCLEDWAYRKHINVQTKIKQKQAEKAVAADGQENGDNIIKQPEVKTPKPYGKWIGFGIVLTIGLGITYLLVTDKKK